MWGYGYGMGWMWLLGGLIIIALAIIIMLMVRQSGENSKRSRGGSDVLELASTPRRLLDERYARGELTAEEYREHVETLRSTP